MCPSVARGSATRATMSVPVSHKEFRAWDRYTAQEWLCWKRALPESGAFGYSLQQWREWIDQMVEIQQALDQIPARRKRTAERLSESSPPWREDTPPAQGSPAQGSAKSETEDSVVWSDDESAPRGRIASTPAQGPPAQGSSSSSARRVIRLKGDNAQERKKTRSACRQEARAQNKDRCGLSFASSLSKAPPICNRVASRWGEDAIACQSELWPQFFGG